MLWHTFNLSTHEAEIDFCEFKASLFYIVNSIARATQWDHIVERLEGRGGREREYILEKKLKFV